MWADNLFAETDRVTACDAQTQVSCTLRCLLTAGPSSIPRRAGSPQDQTGPWCPLLNI